MVRHASLIASALNLPPERWTQNEPAAAQPDLARRVLTRWQHWIGRSQCVTLMDAPISYGQVCGWSPVSQGDQLATLVGCRRRAGRRMTMPQAVVSDGFPQLYFVLGAVERPVVKPELSDAGGDELRRMLAAGPNFRTDSGRKTQSGAKLAGGGTACGESASVGQDIAADR